MLTLHCITFVHPKHSECECAVLQCNQTNKLSLPISTKGRVHNILYPEFLALLAKYLCQRLTVLQESCKMAKFLKYNKLATSVVKIHLYTLITRRCQASVRLNNRWILFNCRFFKFDYTKNQWWIQKYALIIISNERYNQRECPTFSS
jgi:hypothetical protein